MRMIVVGGGVAGLTAADAARCAGAEVTVLEARDRVGGRIRTVPFGPGAVDLGAAWVHAPFGNPVAEALTAAGIKTRNDGEFGAPMAVWRDGWVEAPEATIVASTLLGEWDPVEAQAAVEGDRLTDGLEWFLADRGLCGTAAKLASFTVHNIIGGLVIAGAPGGVSLAGAAAYADGSGGNLVPAGGYRELVDALVAGLDVRLSTTVSAVEHGGPGVSVVTDQGTFDGDYAIVTLPLGMLQAGRVAFDPPLPDSQTSAIERLGVARLEKVALRFSEPFWPESIWEITYVSEDGAFPAWFDFSRHVGAPTLVAFYNPGFTPSLTAMSPAEREREALNALRSMFGAVPAPEETAVTDWENDPYSLGSYSYIPVGAGAEDMRRLSEPASDRLTLAGEVTVPDHYGTVQAAFTSGLRAAGAALGAQPERLTLGAIPPRWLD